MRHCSVSGFQNVGSSRPALSRHASVGVDANSDVLQLDLKLQNAGE